MSGSTAGDLPATSLVICSRNRPQLLGEMVESVLRGHEAPTEIIIIDQSEEANPDLGRLGTDRCDVRHFRVRSVGLERARNEGIAAAEHQLLAFADDDMWVAPNWFGSLVRALLQAGGRAVVTGQVAGGEPEGSGGFAPSTKIDTEAATYEGRVGRDVLYAGNMAMHRSTIEEVGPFEERLGAGSPFRSAEDNDFCFRLLEAGYRIVYVPEAIVYHRAWRTRRDFLPLRWRYGVGQGAFYTKHVGLRDRYVLSRMFRDVAEHTMGAIRRIPGAPLEAFGNMVFVAGMVSGSLRWLVGQRCLGRQAPRG